MTEIANLPPFKVLFVSEIDNLFQEESLWQVFLPWATKIRSICVNRSGDTRSRKSASAYINFYDHTNALSALEHVQPLFLGPSYCRVFPYDGDLYRKPPRPEHYNGCGLFVRHLDPYLSVKQVYEFFRPFGVLQACRIATDDHGISRGFAYVTFESSNAAQTALRETNNQVLGSRAIVVTENRPRTAKGHRLFVRFQQFAKPLAAATEDQSSANGSSNLTGASISSGEIITEEDLLRVFKPYASFDSLTFLHSNRPPGNRHGSRGYAFVTLMDLSDAEHAISTVKEIGGFPATVRFATSDQPVGFTRRPRPSVSNCEQFDRKPSLETVLPSSDLAPPKTNSNSRPASPAHANSREIPVNSREIPANSRENETGEFEPESKRTVSETNLFVRPISPQTTELDLRQHFSPFGALLSVRIMTDPNGESRGFGFVGYESSDSAARAAAALDGSELNGSVMQVSPAFTRRHPPRRNSARTDPYTASPVPLALAASSQVAVPGYYYVPVDYLPLEYTAYGIPNASPVLSGAFPTNYGPAGYSYPTTATPAYPASYPKSPYYSTSISVSPSPVNTPPADSPPPNLVVGGDLTPVNASPPPNRGEPNHVWSAEQQELGESLHPRVLRHPQVNYEMALANIVTGMLLRQPLEYVADWLQQPAALDQVIGQAVDAYAESDRR